jgi:hypothetical protein
MCQGLWNDYDVHMYELGSLFFGGLVLLGSDKARQDKTRHC